MHGVSILLIWQWFAGVYYTTPDKAEHLLTCLQFFFVAITHVLTWSEAPAGGHNNCVRHSTFLELTTRERKYDQSSTDFIN